MSLRTLVNFAQKFGILAEDTRAGDAEEESLILNEDQPEGSRVAPTRPGLPVWVRQRTVEQEVPRANHPWKIEGSAGAQQPPPDLHALGPDALAFYAPFHFYRQGWGIFIRLSGVLHLAEVLKGDILRPGDECCLDLAESLLIEHELLHAAAEIACTRAELTARQPLYASYFSKAPAAHLEEALANAQAVRVFQYADPLRARTRIEQWMSQQGPGYRDYASRLPPREFSKGLHEAACFMTDSLELPCPHADSSLYTFLFRGARQYRKMRVVRIDDLGANEITILRPFPKAYGIQVFVHSREHPPPHIHVKPLDQDDARYSWPDLVPFPDDTPLPAVARKALPRYLESYGAKIDARVKAAFGGI